MDAITIPVSVPTMGSYTFEKLSQELTRYAISLVMPKQHAEQEPVHKEYSAKLQHLRQLSRNNITEQDLKEDDRLAYLMSK